MKYEKPEIFEVKATRCQRCGGILLSEFGLKNGMGHVCKRKADEEAVAREVDENQLTLFKADKEESSSLNNIGSYYHSLAGRMKNDES